LQDSSRTMEAMSEQISEQLEKAQRSIEQTRRIVRALPELAQTLRSRQVQGTVEEAMIMSEVRCQA